MLTSFCLGLSLMKQRQRGNVCHMLFPSPQFSPDSLYIAENSREHEVTVHSTVPIPCYGLGQGQQCGVSLALSVHDPGQTAVLTSTDSLRHEAANVALSACQVELQPNACSAGSCGRASFAVTAVTDFTRDGNRPSLVGIVPAPGAPRLWRNYVPTALIFALLTFAPRSQSRTFLLPSATP